MAITITWPTPANGFSGRILIPKADTTLVQSGPPEIRSINVNELRGEVMALHASEQGGPYYTPMRHTGEVTVSGFTYARQIVFFYEIEFEDGTYVVQVSGGNHNVLDVIVPNSVSVQAQNSAGLVNVLQLYDIAYLGEIYYDAGGLPPGSNDPQLGHGTPQKPVSTEADVIALSSKTGLKSMHVKSGAITLTQSYDNWRIYISTGASVMLNGQSLEGSTIIGGSVSGAATGTVAFEQSSMSNVSGVNFIAYRCRISGTITPAVGDSSFNFCTSGLAGASTPIIDCSNDSGGPISCSIRSYSGGWEVQNSSNINNVFTLEYIAGQLKAYDTVTKGTFVVRGDCFPDDIEVSRAAGTTWVINTTSRSVWQQSVANAESVLDGTFGKSVSDMHAVMGLDPARPLVVTPQSRRVPSDGSDIDQTIGTVGDTVTVTRN